MFPAPFPSPPPTGRRKHELGGGGWNVGDYFFISHGQEGRGRELVMGKHPDLMVGPPTATVFPTNDRKFEISQFFRKKFEKI